jgi:hypothetical protein
VEKSPVLLAPVQTIPPFVVANTPLPDGMATYVSLSFGFGLCYSTGEKGNSPISGKPLA